MSEDRKYNGWTNYETWCVKLWIDNEESGQEYWLERAAETWESTGDKRPNEYMTHERNAVHGLAEELEREHCERADEWAGPSCVFEDLLRSALGEVNWHEIAENLLEDAREAAEA